MKIIISLKQQILELIEADKTLGRYNISTSEKGTGNEKGSNQTPLGKHIVRAKIGGNQPENAVFVGRRPTGELYQDELAKAFPNRDWILSRILWLSGTEKGFNRLGNQDTMQRYIYIHGTPDSEPMGIPLSHGCVRMRNRDVIDLFERVPAGTEVEIRA